MKTIPTPLPRRKRQLAAQRAAARSREQRAVRAAGGGRTMAKQMLAPGKAHDDPEWARKADINARIDPKVCALCGKENPGGQVRRGTATRLRTRFAFGIGWRSLSSNPRSLNVK
jgi:hypothetical protein